MHATTNDSWAAPTSSRPGAGWRGWRRAASAGLLGVALLAAPEGAGASGTAGTWTTPNAMGTARSLHAATVLLDGGLFVVGGRDSGGALATTERYDTATGTWSAKASMSVARIFHTATTLSNGKVLVVGGSGGEKSVELYDPATNTWTKSTSCGAPSSTCPQELPEGRGKHTATLITGFPSFEGQVLVAGGEGNSGWLKSAFRYNPSLGTWTATAKPMFFARAEHTATPLGAGKILVAGGSVGPHPGADTAEIYDPAKDNPSDPTGPWEPTGPMVAARKRAAAAPVSGGRVLVAGGATNLDSGEPVVGGDVASAELFEPATKTWRPVASMATGRSRHTATDLTNGKVLVAGGCCLDSSGTPTASAELYTPPSPTDTVGEGSWASTGTMTGGGRASHTATKLNNDHVLVTGGRVPNTATYLSSTSLYHP